MGQNSKPQMIRSNLKDMTFFCVKLGHNFDFESIGTSNYLICIHPYGQIMMFNVEEIQRSLKFEDAARCVKNGPRRFCGLNSLVCFCIFVWGEQPTW